MQLASSLFTIKLPLNSGSAGVSFSFQSRYLAFQGLLVFQPAVETTPLEHAYFDLGHVQPTGVLGRVVKFQLPQQPSCKGWLECLIQRSRFMGVEIVLNYSNDFSLWVSLIHQPFDEIGIVYGGTPLGHCHVPKTTLWFDQHEQVSRPITFVFVIFSPGFTRLGWQGWSNFLVQLLALFVQTHYWSGWVKGLFVEFKHVFHRGYESRIYLWQAPMLTLPGFQIVFLRVRRMVSYEMVSAKPNSTLLSASSRKVQWL